MGGTGPEKKRPGEYPPFQKPSLPENGQIYIYDEGLRGSGVRLSARTRSFFVERRINRRTKRITIARYPEMTVNEARDEARKLLGTTATGVDPRG